MGHTRSIVVGLACALGLTLFSDLVPATSRLEVGVGSASGSLTGFYGIDRRDGSLGRWTNGEATITLPPRGRWPAEVVIALAGHPERPGERVLVSAADNVWAEVELAPGPAAVRLVVDYLAPRDPIVVRISSGTSVSGDDQRALGVFVYEANLVTGGRRGAMFAWATSPGTWAMVALLWTLFLTAVRLSTGAPLVSGMATATIATALLARLRFEIGSDVPWLALGSLAFLVIASRSASARTADTAGETPATGPGPIERLTTAVGRTMALPAVGAVLASVPIILLLRLLTRHHVDVLYWDQWGMLPFVIRWIEGELGWLDFWHQANEHRPLFARLVLVPLAVATGWNTRAEVALNVGLMAGVFWLFRSALASTARQGLGPQSWMALPLIALLVFSPNQWENWLWGWQFLVFLQVAAVVVGCWLLASEPVSHFRFAMAMTLGVVASYSFGGGLVYWGLGPVALVLGPRSGMVSRLALWFAVAGLTVATYFAGYQSNPGHPSWSANFVDWYSLRNFLGFIPTYVGAPLVSTDRQVARAVGAIGVVAFGVLGALALRQQATRRVAIFPVLMGLWVVGCAALTALGRAPTGQEQALASRYITMSMPFWVALVVLAGVLPDAVAAFSARHRVAAGTAATATLAALILLAVADWPYGAAAFARWDERLRPARAALASGLDDARLAAIFPSVPQVVAWRDDLKRHRLSVFRTTPPAE